jgi:hypothetical protein
MSDGMGTSDIYEYGAVLLSLFSMLMAFAYLRRVSYSYRVHHDDRAAVSLGKAVGLTVITFGLLVSAIGLVTQMAVLSVAGLSVTRGAVIVTLATLLLANVRPAEED